MSRSRKDIIETEEMLSRLADLLRKHDTETANPAIPWSTPRADAEQLRRISMTLHHWHELECGVDAGGIERDEPWAIERAAWPVTDRARWWDGAKWVRKTERRTYSDYEKGELENWTVGRAGFPPDGAWRQTGCAVWWYSSHAGKRTHTVPDREAGALKRLAKIMARYPSLQSYVQTDPRGCALYILRPGDVPAGENAESYYTRGIAVY